MTVQDLINILTQFDPSTTIIKSKDDEGNGYNEVYSYSVGL